MPFRQYVKMLVDFIGFLSFSKSLAMILCSFLSAGGWLGRVRQQPAEADEVLFNAMSGRPNRLELGVGGARVG